jgi:hypothetical protein
MDRDVGYAFVVALSDAIEQATATWARGDISAFRYRGADLRHAVERGLYVGLANNASLLEAYRDGRSAQDVSDLGSALEVSVAEALLGTPGVGHRRTAWRQLAARGLWHARAMRDARVARPMPSASGPITFVVGHRKLLSFVDPIRKRLASPDQLVVATAPNVIRTDDPGPGETIDDAFLRRPAARALGVGLLGATPLLGVYDALLDTFGRRRPRSVLVVEGMSPVDEIANRAAGVLGIPCFCLQQGWSPFVHVGFRNMTFDAMAVWGEGFADLLRPYNPDQRFVAAGSFALAAEVAAGREELASRVGGRPAVAFFLQPESPLIHRRHQAALRRLVMRVATELPECVVLVREHPAAALPAAERDALAAAGVLFAAPERFALRAVLDVADVAVSIYSTSLVEAAALGVVPIVFNPTSMPHYSPDIQALGVGFERKSVDDTEEAIATALRDRVERESLRAGTDRFRTRFFAQHGSPADRVLELVAGAGS